MCDKTHNASCIINDYYRVGKKIWNRFSANKKQVDVELEYEDLDTSIESNNAPNIFDDFYLIIFIHSFYVFCKILNVIRVRLLFFSL